MVSGVLPVITGEVSTVICYDLQLTDAAAVSDWKMTVISVAHFARKHLRSDRDHSSLL